jgi:hypothetical protein
MLACKTKHSGRQGKRIPVQGQLGLHNEFQANLDFIMTLCLKETKEKILHLQTSTYMKK